MNLRNGQSGAGDDESGSWQLEEDNNWNVLYVCIKLWKNNSKKKAIKNIDMQVDQNKQSNKNNKT